MRIIINPASVKIGNRWGNVFIKITDENGYFSMSGVIAPLPSGNALGSCGQMIDSVINDYKEINWKSGWSRSKYDKLIRVWKKWHLENINSVDRETISFIESLPTTKITPAWV